MGYAVGVGATAQVTFRAEVMNQEVLTVLNYFFISGPPVADGRAAIGEFLTKIMTSTEVFEAWRSCLSNQAKNISLRAQWTTPTRFGFITANPADREGAIAADVYPTNTAVAVTRRTGLSGRTQQGDIHMPAVPFPFLENGSVSGDGLTAYGLFALKSLRSLVLPVAGITMVPIPFHRTAPANVSPYIDWTVQPHARTMHRRTVGLGS